MVCQCRRYLRFTPPGRHPVPTLHIASYDGAAGGSGEPDRAYDPVVAEIDMQVALGMVRDDFLRLVGGLSRNLSGAKDRRTEAFRRGDGPVLKWLARFRRPEWVEACLVGAPVGWVDEQGLLRMNGHATLRRLLDQCAVEMALNLGAKVENEIWTWEPLPDLPAPEEWGGEAI
jgi:hypothetical protein